VAITTITGASGSDLTTLKGTELADTFALTSNSLYIDALEGSDTVKAANAVDKITAVTGSGADSLTFSGALTGANLDLGDGNDTTSFQDFAGTLIGGTGNDIADINRAGANSTFKGGVGNDSFIFDTTLDKTLVWGNQDDDTITVSGLLTNSTVYGGKQKDSISVTGATNAKLRGDDASDTITVAGVINNLVIQGNADADKIVVTATSVTSSTVFGGKGADNLDISGAAMLVRGDDDNDDIDVTGNAKYTISGGTGADTIDSSSTKAYKYFGGKGNDSITITGVVASGNHVINGDVGDDTIIGADDAEMIDGGEGKDKITGGGGKDTIYGKGGADSIDVTGGAVVAVNLNILGGTDNDTIKVLETNFNSDDIIKGEAGTADVLQIDDGATLVDSQFKQVSGIETLKLVVNTGTVTVGANAQAAGITTIDNSTSDTANSDIDASAYTSAVGLTIISSKTEASSLIGGAGADTFTLQGDADTNNIAKGGLGIDTFTHSSLGTATVSDLGIGGADVFTVASTAGVLTATAGANYTASASVKNQAAVGNAVITGAGFDINMSNVVTGTSGFTINGNATAASLTGSGLMDSITGGSAADSLVGGAGNDTFNGAAAVDSISGGSGADDFKIYTSATVDVISDFTVADTDQLGFDITDIQLSGIADVVAADSAETVVAANAVITTSADLSGEYDLEAANAKTNLLIAQGNYANAAALQVDVRANLKSKTSLASTDGFLMAYDDGTHTYIAQLDAGSAVIANADVAEGVVTNIAKLSNLSDATTLADTNFFAWIES
jgi:Ca2+-binding RTX toxin-like protein